MQAFVLGLTRPEFATLPESATPRTGRGALEQLPRWQENLSVNKRVNAFAERAKAVNPTENDAIYGPFSIEILARIEARLGDPDRAVVRLNELLSMRYRGPLVCVHPVTRASLQLDPTFDALRSDPRFQKLIASADNKR